MREEFSGIDSMFEGFWEEEETGDRAIIFQIWRVKIKLSDYEESEMNQFWRDVLMRRGVKAAGMTGMSECPMDDLIWDKRQERSPSTALHSYRPL